MGEKRASGFNEALLTSIHDVVEVARYFMRQGGFRVRLPEVILREGYSPGQADQGDLFVTDVSGIELALEVKGHPTQSFDLVESFNPQIVDKVSILKKKKHQPYFYLIMGGDRESFLVFNMKNFSQTEIIPRPDQRSGMDVPTYVVDRMWCFRRDI